MSYLVLARKWRPQRFEAVVGQEHVTQTLRNAIAHHRVAHAYLFTGTRGVGKTTTARILAKALNCLQGPSAEPCNTCSLCTAIAAGSAVDVLEIDGASNRGIDEIRELREKVRYAPAQARTKVYIIDEVHMLTKEAFNALLKTLEEPPANTLFIFATTEAHRIPATILSRCQRFDFHLVPPAELVAHLRQITAAEQVSIGDPVLWLVARAAQGSVRDALSLLDQLLSYGLERIDEEAVRQALGMVGQEVLLRLFAALAGHDPATLLTELQQTSQQGYDMKQLCRSLLEHVRDHLVIQAAPDPQGLVNLPDEEIEALRRQSAHLSTETLQHYFRVLYEADEQMRWAPNARLVLELALIRMAHLSQVVPLGDILGKLAELEAAGGAGAPLSAPAGEPMPLGLFEAPREPRQRDSDEAAAEQAARPPAASPPTKRGPSTPPAAGTANERQAASPERVESLRPQPGAHFRESPERGERSAPRPPRSRGAVATAGPAQPDSSAAPPRQASSEPAAQSGQAAEMRQPRAVGGEGKAESAAEAAPGPLDLLSLRAAIDRAAEEHEHSALHMQIAAARLGDAVLRADGTVELALELSDEFALRKMQRPETLRSASQILHGILQRPVSLTLSCAGASAEGSRQPLAEGPSSAAGKLVTEPIVRAAVEILEGEVLEVVEEEPAEAETQSASDEGDPPHG